MPPDLQHREYDLIIVGTGMGGGTLAYALRESGLRVLLIERGDYLPQEPENWMPSAVFSQNRYNSRELWYDTEGKSFHPGVHYFVGGSTKVYGAALPRLRREDFREIEHEEGISPAWPITYEELEPYYSSAERIYLVHGSSGDDPTEPPRSGPFPYPPVPHESYIEDLCNRLRKQGLHPFFLPMGIDLREGGRCIRCSTCDGFPCREHAKGEADICAVRPALEFPNIEIITRTKAVRLITDDAGGSVTAVELERDGEIFRLHASRYVISCGAVNSAILLLRSANAAHRNGLANSSGLVGRNYMVHNNTALMAVHPIRKNPTVFQKTMAINDFYLRGAAGWHYPLGNLHLLGKLQASMLTANQSLAARSVFRSIANRSVDWWVMSEDLPDKNNRVILKPDGTICLRWKPNNLRAHERLIAAARKMLRRAGYPVILTQRMGIATNAHQCGTLRFGHDPTNSVLNTECRTHDINNLYVMDSSFFPSSTAVNPALTIAAQALRVAEFLKRSR